MQEGRLEGQGTATARARDAKLSMGGRPPPQKSAGLQPGLETARPLSTGSAAGSRAPGRHAAGRAAARELSARQPARRAPALKLTLIVFLIFCNTFTRRRGSLGIDKSLWRRFPALRRNKQRHPLFDFPPAFEYAVARQVAVRDGRNAFTMHLPALYVTPCSPLTAM